MDQMNADISTQRELNVCLQDVTVTQEEFGTYKNSLAKQFDAITNKNSEMVKQIKDL